jgi:hypothetical protein
MRFRVAGGLKLYDSDIKGSRQIDVEIYAKEKVHGVSS